MIFLDLTWLHISDVHFHYSSYESLRIREEFIKKIKSISKNAKIDCVFCTGDLADRNGKYQPELVDYLSEIAKSVGVIKNYVFIVPGNHDHCRDRVYEVLDEVYSPLKKEKISNSSVASHRQKMSEEINEKINTLSSENYQILYESFSQYEDVCKNFYGTKERFASSSVDVFPSDRINIVKINTCLFDRFSNDDSKELHVGIKKIHEIMKAKCIDEDSINIAIGHHPTAVMCEYEKERFLDSLKSNNIHLYLSGHMHKSGFYYHSKFDIHESVCGYGNSNTYSSGGFSVGKIDTEKNEYYVDFYNWKKDDTWVRDTSIDNCSEIGRCYFNGIKYKHKSHNNIAVTIKMYGPEINRNDIKQALGTDDFDVLSYLTNEIDVKRVEWDKEIERITSFANIVKQITNKNISIFSLAPIPILITLGFELQKNSKVFLYQHDREASKYVKSSKKLCPKFEINWRKKAIFRKSKKLIIKIATSTEISNAQIPKIDGVVETIELVTVQKTLGEPLYDNHYEEMLSCLFKQINPIASKYEEIHIFASVPAGMAIELGRNLQKGVYPPVHLYNYSNGYTFTNIINT